MNLTRDIVKDLLPLYAAGEISADGRAAVDGWLRADAELRAYLDALSDDRPSRPVPAGPPDAGLAALATTKRLLRRRTWLLAWAGFFTVLPFAFAFNIHGVSFLMVRDAPMQSLGSLVVAAGLWVGFALTARRLRVSGL